MTLRGIVAAALWGGCSTYGIPEPCIDLAIYYDECCDLCGPQDYYCSVMVIDDRRLCRKELRIWDDECYCD